MLDLSRLVTLGFDALDRTADSPSVLHDRAEEHRDPRACAQSSPSRRARSCSSSGSGLGAEEAAKILDLEYATLRKRLSRARAELQSTMVRPSTFERQARQETASATDPGTTISPSSPRFPSAETSTIPCPKLAPR